MPYTWDDFEHWYIQDHFLKLTPEEQRVALERLPPDRRRELLKSLPAEERLAGLAATERVAGLPVEERLAGLPTEEIRQYLEQMTARRPATPRKPKRKK